MRKKKRNHELLGWIREQSCVVCGRDGPSDPSHIRSVGAAGYMDVTWNVFPFCRVCHREWHDHGRMTFVHRHPEFMRLLKLHDWELINGTLSNPRFFKKPAFYEDHFDEEGPTSA